ncbi:MAG: hypothetical protein GTO41_14405, partial [Burkholderiales bacterium]|nr:hypothetical protein [Burkholderiales bacterium]
MVKHTFDQSTAQPLLTSRQIFGVMALLALPVMLYAFWRLPQAAARIVMLWITRCLYRVQVKGLENIPEQGGAVLVGNHISWIDGALYLILIPRRLRLIAWAGNFQSLPMRLLARFCKVILIT